MSGPEPGTDAGTPDAARGIAPAGEVELVGRRGVSGWLAPRADGTFPLVEIHLHGHHMRSLRVRHVADDGRGRFSIPFAESFLRYVPGPGALRFVVDGAPLPVVVDELPVRPDALGEQELAERLEAGFFLAKFGGLRLPLELDTGWQERTFAHYAHVRDTMRELFDYDVHAAYGTLLGIVREGAFIDGDDDFDASFHSRKTSARAVRDELFEIATTLAARGEDVQLSGRKFLHWYGRGSKIDLFPSWSRGPHFFQAHVVGGPYAHVFDAGYREIEFKGRAVSVPVDAEGALAATYGSGWRTPDPLFQWRVQPEARRAMRRLRLTAGQMSLVQWERRFAGLDQPDDAGSGAARADGAGSDGAGADDAGSDADHDGTRGSELAHLAAHRITDRITGVIDLGCGSGQDTRVVAGTLPALGLDGSRAALAAAASRGDEHTRFVRVDVGDARKLRRTIRPLTSAGPVAVYARQLFEAVELETEETARAVLERELQPGSLVLAEIVVGEETQPERGVPLLRAIDPRELAARWTRSRAFALELLEHEPSTGVARIVLRRRSDRARRAARAVARVRRVASRVSRAGRRRATAGEGG